MSSTERNTTLPTCARFLSPKGKIVRCLPELRRRVKVTNAAKPIYGHQPFPRILGRNIKPAMHSALWEAKSKLLADFWTRKVRVNETSRSKSIRRLRQPRWPTTLASRQTAGTRANHVAARRHSSARCAGAGMRRDRAAENDGRWQAPVFPPPLTGASYFSAITTTP